MHVLCLRPRSWCLMVRIAGSDVASSNSFSSDQVITAAGSGACALPCGSSRHARGVVKSICIGCPFSTSMGTATKAERAVGTTWSAARKPRVRSGVSDRSARPQSARPPSGRPSPAPCLAAMHPNLSVSPSPAPSVPLSLSLSLHLSRSLSRSLALSLSLSVSLVLSRSLSLSHSFFLSLALFLSDVVT